MSFLVACRRLRMLALVAVAAALAASPALAGRLLAPSALAGAGIAHVGVPAKAMPTMVVKAAGGVVDVVEFYNATLDHYFISADPAEIAVLDSGAFGGAWKRTGNTFPAWDIVGSPAGTVPVCRFFGTDRYRANGSRIGPNSHFYTADPAECAFVKTAYQSEASDGVSYPAWTFEANAVAVRLPVGGACPAGTQALYRAYNNGARGDPNHRYSLQARTVQGMTGWTFEGLVMCLAQGTRAVLPSQMTACELGACPAASTTLGNGMGFVEVTVTIANPTGDPYELLVPAGQTFTAVAAANQDGLAAETLRATIQPGTTRSFVLSLFCLQVTRDAAHAGTAYAVGPVTGNAGLRDIAAIVDGRLGAAFDTQQMKTITAQFAVWEITDGRGALTGAQRQLLVQIMNTPPTDETLPALAEQFYDMLSP